MSDERIEEVLARAYNEACADIERLKTENHEWRMGKLHSPVPHLEDVRRLTAEVKELRGLMITVEQTSAVAVGRYQAESEDANWRADQAIHTVAVLSAEVERYKAVVEAAREIAAFEGLGTANEFDICDFCEVDFLTAEVEYGIIASHTASCPVPRLRAALAALEVKP